MRLRRVDRDAVAIVVDRSLNAPGRSAMTNARPLAVIKAYPSGDARGGLPECFDGHRAHDRVFLAQSEPRVRARIAAALAHAADPRDERCKPTSRHDARQRVLGAS